MGTIYKVVATFLILAAHADPVMAAGQYRMRDIQAGAGENSDPAVVYVNKVASSTSPDGQSWATAYTSLAEALASDLSAKEEIWVAGGTYYPTVDTDRNASFTLSSGIDIYGGFIGNELRREQRNWQKNVTILSGEIGEQSDMTDNVYHVVTGADDAILDGFTIRNGYAILAEGEVDNSGCMIDVPDAAADDEILRIVTNTNKSSGGGLLNVQAGTTTRNCLFANNYASKGGAVYNMVTKSWNPASMEETVIGDSPTFDNCIFISNHATARGGAVNNDFYTSSTFINCVFVSNECDAKGGAVYADMGSPVNLLNVLFYQNEAERGAALVADGVSSHRVAYATFLENSAYGIGAALYQGTYMGEQRDGEPYMGNEVHLYSSIVIGNTSASSTTSISNWHDGAALFDEESIVETTDGSLDVKNYIRPRTYEAKNSELGWQPGRNLDTKYWLDLFEDDSNRTYTAYSYDTTANPSGNSGTIYVNGDAEGLGNGKSWDNAYISLSDALENASYGADIWVAEGTYKPTTGTDRSETFVMKEGVNIYGGFAGTEEELDSRDYETNITILSGEIGIEEDNSDNSYHVLFGASNAVLDGFVIQDGYADGDFYHSRGGGLLCYNSASPEITNCTFQFNSAVEGGAIASYYFSAPTITNCFFEDNWADIGGAMLFRVGPNSEESGSVVSDTSLLENYSMDRGGAVYIDYGAWTSFNNCLLSGNVSDGNGGAVYVDNNSSQLSSIQARFTSSDFTGNSSAMRGGAFAIYEGTAFLDSSTITGNIAGTGGGGIALDYRGSFVNVANSSSVTENSSTTGESDIDDASDMDSMMAPVEGDLSDTENTSAIDEDVIAYIIDIYDASLLVE